MNMQPTPPEQSLTDNSLLMTPVLMNFQLTDEDKERMRKVTVPLQLNHLVITLDQARKALHRETDRNFNDNSMDPAKMRATEHAAIDDILNRMVLLAGLTLLRPEEIHPKDQFPNKKRVGYQLTTYPKAAARTQRMTGLPPDPTAITHPVPLRRLPRTYPPYQTRHREVIPQHHSRHFQQMSETPLINTRTGPRSTQPSTESEWRPNSSSSLSQNLLDLISHRLETLSSLSEHEAAEETTGNPSRITVILAPRAGADPDPRSEAQ